MKTSAETLLQFVNEDLLGDSGKKVALDTLLFEEGGLDSLKILKLIAFLELESGRKIPDELIVMDRFRSVEVITRNFLET